MLLLLILAGSICFSRNQVAEATINRQINFQGKIVNTNGTNITNGTYNMEFKIYSGGDGDPDTADETLLWTESRLRNDSQGVSITDGIFQVNLGSITSLPGSVDFNNSTLWLSLNLGNTNATCTPFSSCSPDGQMDPFVRFTAAPYAFNSDTLDGIDSAAFGQLAASQTWTGTQTLQPTTNISSLIVKQTSVGSPTADIINIQTANGTDVIEVTGPAANQASVNITSVGSGQDIVLTSADDMDLNVNDLFTLDAATMTFTLASGSTDFTIAGLDADSNLILPGMAGANAVMYASPTTGVVATATTTTGSQCLLSAAGASGTPSWGSCSAGSTPDFDAVYAQSITNGNLVMEIDDAGGLAFDLTTTGDFEIRDAGTAVVVVDDAGLVDINRQMAIGNTATPSTTVVAGVDHSFDNTVDCTAGCRGFDATVRANKPTGFASGSIQGFRLATGTDATTAGNAYTLANAIALTIDGGSAGANAAISNNYGILINDQTKGTSDYGMVIQGADTYALWVQADPTRLDGTLSVGGNTTLTGDIAVNGGDITSSGALNITPGGALVVGATGQTATLQGSTTTLTSTGAGNDITLNSADQTIFKNASNTVATLNSEGRLELIANGLTVSAISEPIIDIGATVTKNTGTTSFYALNFDPTINIDADPGLFGGDLLFRDASTEAIDSSVDNAGGHTTFFSAPNFNVTNSSTSTIGNAGFGTGITGLTTDAFLRGGSGSSLTVANLYGARIQATTVGDASNPNVTLTNRYGVKVENAAGNGTVTTQYGIWVDNMTKGGTNDYGIYIGGGDTNALWVDSGSTQLDGTLTVGDTITTSNKGVEFTESDTNPTCSTGNYSIFADLSETKLKKCVNGTVSDIDAGTKYETFTGNGTYTKPTDAVMVIIEMWGAGAGGGGGAGGSNAAARTGGGGGGGGAFVTEGFLASNLGSTVEVTVGTGGSAGAAGSNAVGGDGTAGGSSCFSTSSSCGGTMILRAYGGGFGNGDGAAGNGGGGGGGAQGAGGNAATTTFGAGGAPISGTAAASAVASDGNGGGNGGTAGTGTVNGGGSHYGGGGGAPSTTAGGSNSGAGGASTRGGGAGGGGGSCPITTCTARSGGAGGATGGGIVSGGTAGSSGGNGGNGGAGTTIYGGGGGGGGADNSAAAGGTAGNGGIPGGGGGGGGGAHTGSTVGGAGGTGARGEVRIWSVRGSGADLAEIYATKEDLKAGEVVCLDPTLRAGVKRCTKAYDKTTFGVITTSPGLVIGDIEDVEAASAAPVVLAGRTPVKVSTENGPIKAGDLLTPSSQPGVAMRATKAGQIIGQAMAPFDGEGVGNTVVFVKTNFSQGSTSGLLEGLDQTNSSSVGKQMLAYLTNEKTPIDQTKQDLSETFTDRVSAALDITAPKVTTDELAVNTIEAATNKDINLKLSDGGKFLIKNPTGQEILRLDSASATVALDLDVQGGLTVGGPATFNGNVFFHKLATFVEKTIFKNDVTLGGHLLTDGTKPDITTEPAAGITKLPIDNPRAQLASATITGNDTSGVFGLTTGEGVTKGKALSVKFNKTFAKPPKILLTPANDYASQAQYFVESTKDGFTLTLTSQPIPGISLAFNYWVVE